MPKLKTHRGAAKRYKLTGSGNYKHKRSFVRHNLTKKAQSRKRNLRGLELIDHSDFGSIVQMLPYNKG